MSVALRVSPRFHLDFRDGARIFRRGQSVANIQSRAFIIGPSVGFGKEAEHVVKSK